jgi:hypothetical protein
MAARSLKVESIIAPVQSDVEIEMAINDLREQTALSGKDRIRIDRRYVVSGRRRYDRRAMREPGGGLVAMPDVFMVVRL